MQLSLKQQKSRGFTIVELLIVIVVIGILAVIAVISYGGIQAKALDKAVQSDADSLEGLETRYATNNSNGGKAWYSGTSGTNGAADSSLGLSPTKGNVIDVTVNSTDYCIRIYNPSSSTYKTLGSAFKKGSTNTACSGLMPSVAAQTDSPLIPVATTIAGSTSGNVDGQGTAAKFNLPNNIAVDSTGNLYVTDESNQNIRMITATGYVSTLAGSAPQGYQNGSGSSAKFYSPHGLAVGGNGNIYVADTSNNRIRMIDSSNNVTTFAGSGTLGSQDSTNPLSASFNQPYNIAQQPGTSDFYVSDQGNYRIRKISASGAVTTLAGSTSGYQDGTGTGAKFGLVSGLTVDGSGNVYVIDGQKIRKVTSSGVVTTIASSSSIYYGNAIAVDGSGNVYVEYSNQIHRITQSGTDSVIAGSGTNGYQDGTGNAIQFGVLYGIAVDSSGVIYVVDDYPKPTIRKITFQ